MRQFELNKFPHRRKNILTGEWILVSPNRTDRPWQGATSVNNDVKRPKYDPNCYLCPGNKRANGIINPAYENTFVFTNDFSSMTGDIPEGKKNNNNLLIAKSERGICRVVNFSPHHDVTLAEMPVKEIEEVISTWQHEFDTLGSNPVINHVQIFENKGQLMGNSNPHPHCQIWAQESIPAEPARELKEFIKYYRINGKSILSDYLKLERKLKERIVYENHSFTVLVPFWAVWPFETMIISKRKIANILKLTETEKKDFADSIKAVTVKYDNLFRTSFPYSSGIHQAPTDEKKHEEYHFHMHFYPPLLRSAEIKKFMVGYEMLAEPQRDITPEASAVKLRELPDVHYKILDVSTRK
jgi:UDPglucose--hexose-1-phosphate uridylyltransferase